MILGDQTTGSAAANGADSVTIDDIFRSHAHRRPNALALIDATNRESFTDGKPRRLTYAVADRVISAMAGRLHQMGLPADSVIAIQLPNVAENILVMLAVWRAGKATLLVVIGRGRTPLAPEVPTAEEAGYPELAVDSIQGFFGWRDMPNDLRDRIAADVRAVAADPTISERLALLGQTARSGTPAEFMAMLDKQRAEVAAIAKAIRLEPIK